jgi:hypothetical protein
MTAILRAGPFCTRGNAHVNEEEAFTQPVNANQFDLVVPVNCALNSWSQNDRWKYLQVTSFTTPIATTEVHGVAGNSFTAETGTLDKTFDFEGVYFAYQADKPFTISGSFSAFGSFGQQDDITFRIKDNSNDVEYFSFNNGTRNISGSFSGIELPVSFKPRRMAFQFEGGIAVGNGVITLTGLNL